MMSAISEQAKANRNRISLESYYSYKAHGICWKCKTRWAEPGQTYCGVCKRRVKAEAERRDPGAEKRKASCRERRARLIASGLCVSCGKVPPRDGKQKCEKCAAKQAEYALVRKIKQRVKEGKA